MKKETNPIPRVKKPTALNPLQNAIHEFLTNHIPQPTLTKHGLSNGPLHSLLPKRFTIYEPMLLLPVNALSTPPAWRALYQDLDSVQRNALFAALVTAFGRLGVTHVAMNAPIALTDMQGQENRMRSPAGLVPLYGDFGTGESGGSRPTREDLDGAFWVRTMQNHGIVQIWAPLYTMFSRGNVTEKARVLGQGGFFEGLDEGLLGEMGVVDLYAGIGYFVFSYLKRGVRRVWGWEMNGWSVEGLRRGCIENGWGCRVVRLGDDGRLSRSELVDLVRDLKDTDRVVLFHGDNRFAADILEEIRGVHLNLEWWSVRHVNLGLLPTSVDAWENACRMIDIEKGGWAHVHENVDLREIELKKEDITTELGRLRAEVLGLQSAAGLAECRHVEHVKTYAPGVMHCVYDMKLLSYTELQQKTAH
ncbi:S-adenosyl-L-methionine-dependent methyltransferase [Aspergillus coremiiformis]|uniref:tRNA wybutosine-synthesizing protein 2 n=1 Tax=Aspergillus coremiiformis TaxID=138285 RepID=A0A5N6Z4P7_9EURO|nr:S-adenosyl-L-methionine-dependent methyltransferase [Aspergillus coremiiformis]